jgi:hypothetical protein
MARRCVLCFVLWGAMPPPGVEAQGPTLSAFDEVLDQYVRDGLVYYAALRQERRSLDQFMQSLAGAPEAFQAWSRDRRLAYWINGYNALVLGTVIDHYPVRGTSSEFPANSVMQIPGMFTGREHAIAGRRMTLQAIEDEIAGFGDPRALLALGRGAVGSPRLRSEAFRDNRLKEQLEAVVADFATTPRHVRLDRSGAEVRVNAMVGWRSDQFSVAAGEDDGADTGRSPIERAIVALISPALFPNERAFLAENTYRLQYLDFDWQLNDLTGGRPY